MGSVNLVISKHRERKGKKMVTIKQENFSIEQICNSGQCFRMKEIGGGVYEVIAFGKYLEVTQKGDEITFSCTKEGNTWKLDPITETTRQKIHGLY